MACDIKHKKKDIVNIYKVGQNRRLVILELFSCKMRFTNLQNRPILKSFLIMNVGSLLSKVLGFARNPILVISLGASLTDNLLAADKIGQSIALILVIGTLYNAVLPILVRIKQENAKYLNSFLTGVMAMSTTFVTLLCAISIICAPQLIIFFTDSTTLKTFSSSEYTLFLLATRILLLTPIFLTIQTFLSAYLSIHNKYTSVSLAGIISNIIIITAALLSKSDYIIIVYGILSGIALSNCIIFWECMQNGLRLDFSIGRLKHIKSELNKFIVKSLPRTLIVDPINVCLLLVLPIKNFSGQVTLLDILFSIIGAFSFISLSFSTAIFPKLSEIPKLSTINQQKVINNTLAKFFKVSLVQLLISIIGGLILLQVYIEITELNQYEEYLFVAFLIALPSLLLVSLRQFLQKVIFSMEDNFIIFITTVCNLILIISALCLNLVINLDTILSIMISYGIFHVAWLLWVSMFIFIKYKLNVFQVLAKFVRR